MNETIPEETLKMIGDEKTTTFDVTLKDIKRFAQAIDDPNPLYADGADLSLSESYDVTAPALFCQTFAFADVPLAELTPDGAPVEINIPLPVEKTVGGGSVFEIDKAVRPGDRITAKSRVSDVFTKTGKSGLLYFVIVKTSFFNQHDQRVARETATFIKR
jgi:hydroxyacyl-ACP dehydratase HTD2-like protein with hotdog domain